MIADRTVTRVYTAHVWGHLSPDTGIIDAPIDRHPKYRTLRAVVPEGRPATTHYETSAQYRFLSRLTVTLGTGRTHQIRVHLAHIGHHVFGDPVYGGREERLKGFSPEVRIAARKLLAIMPRQALHAGRLSFTHPVTSAALSFNAEPPADMLALQDALEGEPGRNHTIEF
jgi:23S rRNA pseudouridine1911/1915/1917 synthase